MDDAESAYRMLDAYCALEEVSYQHLQDLRARLVEQPNVDWTSTPAWLAHNPVASMLELCCLHDSDARLCELRTVLECAVLLSSLEGIPGTHVELQQWCDPRTRNLDITYFRQSRAQLCRLNRQRERIQARTAQGLRNRHELELAYDQCVLELLTLEREVLHGQLFTPEHTVFRSIVRGWASEVSLRVRAGLELGHTVDDFVRHVFIPLADQVLGGVRELAMQESPLWLPAEDHRAAFARTEEALYGRGVLEDLLRSSRHIVESMNLLQTLAAVATEAFQRGNAPPREECSAATIREEAEHVAEEAGLVPNVWFDDAAATFPGSPEVWHAILWELALNISVHGSCEIEVRSFSCHIGRRTLKVWGAGAFWRGHPALHEDSERQTILDCAGGLIGPDSPAAITAQRLLQRGIGLPAIGRICSHLGCRAISALHDPDDHRRSPLQVRIDIQDTASVLQEGGDAA